MQYENVVDYVRAVGRDPSLALIPIPMAAELFGITGAGISARVKSGALHGIKVSGSRYVLLDSVVTTLKKSDKEVAKVRDFLENQARKGISSIEYEPVMNLLGFSSTRGADRTRIGWILGAVSRETYKDGNGLLSVIVHRKGTSMPSEKGFFRLVDNLIEEGAIDDWKSKHNSREKFVAAETKRVLKAYSK